MSENYLLMDSENVSELEQMYEPMSNTVMTPPATSPKPKSRKDKVYKHSRDNNHHNRCSHCHNRIKKCVCSINIHSNNSSLSLSPVRHRRSRRNHRAMKVIKMITFLLIVWLLYKFMAKNGGMQNLTNLMR